MKVLLDARMVSSNTHGIGRYTVNLAQGLHRRGHQVTILSHYHTTAEVIGVEAIENVVPCLLPFAHPLEILELSRVVQRVPFDVAHFPSFSIPLFLPRHSVVTIHDLIHLYPPARLAHQIYYKTVVKRALRSCRHIIAVSEWTKNDLNEKLQVPPDHVTVVRNGLEEKWLSAPQTPAPPLNGPFFLCLSNLKHHKNVKTLLEACRRLWNENCAFNLVLSLGGHDLPPEFKDHRVRILRNATDLELVSYFKHAAAVVSPSLYEGFDYPAAEGLALNRPVIVSRGSAHDELKGDRLAFYTPADDVAALALELMRHLEAPVEKGPALHNVSTIEKMIDETIAVYDRAFHSNTRG